MTLHVQQHIYIGNLRIEAITNSSMLQIGTSGGINATSYSTVASPIGSPDEYNVPSEFFMPTLVPLPNPT